MLVMVLSMAMPWPRPWPQHRWWRRKWMPWPARHERKERVRSAQEEADESRRKAESAHRVARELRQSSGDAIAQVIIDGLQKGRHQGRQAG